MYVPRLQLHPILEPDDVRPRLSGGHADEDDLVAQHVLVVEVRGFGYSSTLEKQQRTKLLDSLQL